MWEWKQSWYVIHAKDTGCASHAIRLIALIEALPGTKNIFRRPRFTARNEHLTKTHHGGTETRRKTGENQLHRGGAEKTKLKEDWPLISLMNADRNLLLH